MKMIVCGVLGLLACANAALAQDEAEVFEWKLKPTLGLSGRYTLFTRMKFSQNLPALPATKTRAQTAAERREIDSQQTMTIDYETISRDLQGGTVERFTYRTIKKSANLKINGQTVAMSNNLPEKALQNIFAGLQFDIKRGPDGRVWNVQGVEKMRLRIESALARQSPQVRAPLQQFFAEIFSEENLRRTWDSGALHAPTPLRVGESWEYQLPAALSVLNLERHGARQLVALKGDFATISDRGSLTAKFDTSMTGGGTLSGTSIINRTTGMEVENFFTQRWTTRTKTKLVADGRTISVELPQWFLVQSHLVFQPNEIESIE